jgi:hypothetical protein
VAARLGGSGEFEAAVVLVDVVEVVVVDVVLEEVVVVVVGGAVGGCSATWSTVFAVSSVIHKASAPDGSATIELMSSPAGRRRW